MHDPDRGGPGAGDHSGPAPAAGHNHAATDHLHSHVHRHGARDRVDATQTLATSFIDGFRQADDKTSFLRLAGIPFHREGPDGRVQHLVDARIESNWQVGTASPAFGTPDLVYMPYPGAMVRSRETMTFTYVSLSTRADIDLTDLLQARLDADGSV